jgi:hypothetical protein
MDAHQERMGAIVNAWRKETTACQEATEACLESKEPTSVEIESVAVHDDVPKEEAAVKIVRAPKEQYGDQHLAIGHRRRLKKWTQGDGGSLKKLVAVQEQHGVRGTVIQNRRSNRDDRKIGSGTML